MRLWKISAEIGTDEMNTEKVSMAIKTNTGTKAIEEFKKSLKEKYTYINITDIRRLE